MALFPLNHGPSTAAEWKARLAKLQGEGAEAEQRLAEARQARADADAQGVLSGQANASLSKLESQEAKAERDMRALQAALAMATQQLAKAQAEEQRAEQERLRQLRAKLRGEIVARSGKVDALFAAAAAELNAIDGLLTESFRAGRGVPHRVKTYATRAMIACGLHSYFESSGGWSARELLSTQLDRLLAEPPAQQQPQQKSA